MGKKSKGRTPRINISQIPKIERIEAVSKYNESPDTVRIYFDKIESSLIIVDSRFEKREINLSDGNILFIIGGRKNRRDKINKSDIVNAINDELEYWFYNEDEIFNEY